MKEIYGIIALALSISANVPYIIDIIKKRSTPQRTSWLIWTALGLVYFLSTVFDNGAVLFTTGELIGPVVIFVLSLKYGVGGFERSLDRLSVIVAFLALALLLTVDSVIYGLLLALFIDVIGIGLTIKEVVAKPGSESRSFWLIGAISAIFAVLSLESFNFVALAFPVYVIGVSTIVAILAKPAPRKSRIRRVIDSVSRPPF